MKFLYKDSVFLEEKTITETANTLNEYIKDAALKAIPLSRFGSPSDVAKGILFLASPDADYITGHVLQIDGGLAM